VNAFHVSLNKSRYGISLCNTADRQTTLEHVNKLALTVPLEAGGSYSESYGIFQNKQEIWTELR